MNLRIAAAGIFVALTALASARTIDLSGDWKVELDNDTTTHLITLPGTTDLAGLGVPNVLEPELKKPQLLRLTRKNRFIGRATYSRTVHIDGDMAGKPLELKFERVMWRSRLSIDGQPVGMMQESLSTPHRYYLPDGLDEGEHQISLEIDNGKMYEISDDELAHAYTDDTQIKWNGVLGNMSLRSVEPVDVASVQVYTDDDLSGVEVVATVNNHKGKKLRQKLEFRICSPDGREWSRKVYVNLAPGANVVKERCGIAGERQLWSEFSPVLYEAEVAAGKSAEQTHFGLRKIESRGHELLINGNPVFLRGSLECCVFPLTGTPPLGEAGWEAVFDTAEQWGLNHLRFHSWCPPEAAFAVADRHGFYLQVELPIWSTSLQAGENGGVKDFIKSEYDRIVEVYGNHPSFVMMTVGNELQSDFVWLNDMVRYMKKYDPRRLYAASSFTFERGHGGHPEENDDFMVSQWTDAGWVRGQGVFDKEAPSFDKNYDSSTGFLDVPLITHEIGQYAVYPDLTEIEKYTGVLDPLNFKAVKADLEAKGRLHKAEDYLKASGALAALLYKEEIERALKTNGIAGIQLLSLTDFPGQGTALVGLVNAFGESKGVAQPEWFRGFCAPRVALAMFEKATYRNDEEFRAKIDVANYLREENNVGLKWRMVDEDGREIASGNKIFEHLTQGHTEGGEISVALSDVRCPMKLVLEASVDGNFYPNKWNIWVYPSENDEETHDGVVITSSLTEARKALDSGERVIFSPSPDSIRGIESKFVPVFWSPVHFPTQSGGMGILCDATHPALADFPNDGHTDWQWWHPVKNSRTFETDSFPGSEAVIEVVDNFVSNRSLALVAEGRCSNGRVLVCGIDIMSPEAMKDPATAQLRRSLLKYVVSEKFDPNGMIEPDALEKLINDGHKK